LTITLLLKGGRSSPLPKPPPVDHLAVGALGDRDADPALTA
jgi:hypothetical protein